MLYEKASQLGTRSYATEAEHIAVDRFIEAYRKKHETAIQEATIEANKQRYTTATSDGDRHFDAGRFSEALAQFDSALTIPSIPGRWTGLARMKKWRCLLELALADSEESMTLFNKASSIAGDEAQIRELIQRAYDGHPDRAPLELYYCMFYVMKYKHAGNETERQEARQLFDLHREAISRSSSGYSDSIMTRIEHLRTRFE